MKTNKNGVKLLAAIMVFAMAFAGAFILIGSDDSDSAVTETNVAQIGTGNDAVGYDTLADAIKAVTAEKNTITLLKDCEIEAEEIDLSAKNTSITIDGGEKTKYDITLKGTVKITMASGKTITIQNADIVNTDDSNKTTSYELLFEGTGSKVVLNNCEFTGDANVEYGLTLNSTGVTGEFTNVDFNEKVVGTHYNTNTMKVVNCQDLRINITMTSSGEYTLGTNGFLDIDSASASSTTLNFAADGEGDGTGVVLTLDLNDGNYTFKNINERRFASYTGAHLEIINGTLTNTTFGTYVGDLDDPTTTKIERASYIHFGTDVTLAGKTVIAKATITSADSVNDIVTINGTVTFAKGASIQLEEKSKIASLRVNSSDDESYVDFANLVAGTAKMTISDGSVIIDGSYVESGTGAITITGNAKILSNVNNTIDITVNSGAVLTIPEGVTVETIKSNAGTLMIYGSVGGVTDNTGGTVAVAPGVSKPTGVTTVVSTGSLEDSFGMSKDLESDYTVVTKAFLEKDLTIPEGITLTVKGTLDLNGYDLTVKGKLVIESKGTVVDVIGSTKGIILASTGTIDNAGIIGKDSDVTVKDQQNTPASVKMKNVVGINFALTKEITTGAKYILTVSGEVSKKSSDYALTITNAYIDNLVVKDLVDDPYSVVFDDVAVLKNGQLTIGSKAVVEITGELVLKDNATLTIDGKITNGNVHMMNGSVVAINGIADEVGFCAKTGDYKTYNDTNGSRYNVETMGAIDANKTIETQVTFDDINGITLEVTSKAITGADKKPWTTQMLNVYGTASYNKEAATTNPEGTISIDDKKSITDSSDSGKDGAIIIPAGKELTLGDDGMILVSTYGATITTSGLLKVLNNDNIIDDSGEKISFVGAFYTIEATTETGTKYDVYYYTTVDDAYSIIDTVDEKTIVVSGDFEFAKDYTVKAGQTIDTVSGTYTIKKGATVTVEAEGKLFNEFTAADSETSTAAGIQGTLIVMDGATCTPNAGSYEVSSKDADNNRTYSGAATAIENATAGSTIYISNPVTFTEKTSIPADVTVDVASGATIKASKGLTVNGKILNNGNVDVTGALVVAGELENRGTVSVGGDDKAVTVTGKYIGLMAAGITPNAATYNDGTDIIYTTVQSAVAASSAMDVPETVTVTGKFTENADITLAEGMKLTIDGEIVLKSVRLSSMSTLDVNGKLSADVIAAVGKVDTTGAVSDATVNLNKVSVIEIKLAYSEATTTYTMTMSDYTAGAVTVKNGSVTLDASSITLTEDKTLGISAGATVVNDKASFAINGTDSAKKYLDNAGTIALKKSSTISDANIGGNITVAVGYEVTIEDSVITGTVTLETKENKEPASAIIKGTVLIGSAPETLGADAGISGKVTFADGDAYVIVFAGTFATTVEDVKSTAYTVNGINFAKVYAADGNDVGIDTVDDLVSALDDLNVTGTIAWMNGTENVSAQNIGYCDFVDATIGYRSATVKVSAAPGLIVYIDDVLAPAEKLYTVGTHTITVYIDLGYEGTPAISFNGQKVTDGKFVITSDMIGENNLIVVTGATPAVTPTPEPTPEKDDGMGLTDYLLIVLVILAAILVVVVAIRMMRS